MTKFFIGFIKQFVNDTFFSDNRKGLPSGVQIAPFSQSNEVLCQAPQLFSFRVRGPNTLILKQRGDHIAEHR
jgi:hypothetical protein